MKVEEFNACSNAFKWNLWAHHIIHRFGESDAYKYAICGAFCPCMFLEKSCGECEHYRNWPTEYLGCTEANIFTELKGIDVKYIKNMIVNLIEWNKDSRK